ncbi:hypothetical protein A9Q99_18225 [Gammaproteobacteria bacterium 45_16_T64]|nr:hypothetical protein A9Q99_18225 [Gammaproteobacteria bacterium 45_16_T64]
MIESIFTYNLSRDFDERKHWDIIKDMLTALEHDKMIVSFRIQHNIMGSPSTKVSIFWDRATHWAAFVEMDEWRQLSGKLNQHTDDLKVELWSDSGIDFVTATDISNS